MRLLCFIALLMFGVAHAEPACVPGVYGEQWPGSKVAVGVKTAHGLHAYGWCTFTEADGIKRPSLRYRTCALDECQAIALAKASDVAYRCSVTIDEDMTLPEPDPASSRGLACAELRALVYRDTPVADTVLPPAYQVKPSGSATTRPAYALTNGVKGTKELARATIGQPCDTTRPTLASGADLWAEFAPSLTQGVVALCSKKP